MSNSTHHPHKKLPNINGLLTVPLRYAHSSEARRPMHAACNPGTARLKHGSLFSGIGGLDLAIEALGFETVWQVEQDDYCQKVLAKHWPDVTRYGDVTVIDWSDVAPVDAISAGFPCQPVSVAGKQKGIEDARWLWPEVVRCVRALRPQFVFLENVPGLISTGLLWNVLGDLAEIGFDAEWTTVRAADVGAPHRRERVFILAYRNRFSESESWEQAQSCGTRKATRNESWREGTHLLRASNVAYTDEPHGEYGDGQIANGTERDWYRSTGGHIWPPRPDDHEGWSRLLTEMPQVEPAVCRDADGVSNRTHRLRALGNAVVPQQAEYAFRILMELMELMELRAYQQ